MNRKIVGACSLILAIKVNDSRNVMIGRLEELCRRLHLPEPQQIISHEFAVFAAPKFSLHLPNTSTCCTLKEFSVIWSLTRFRSTWGEDVQVLDAGWWTTGGTNDGVKEELVV